MEHLTVDETAKKLKTTPKGIRHRIDRGQLPFKRWGRRILIPVGELENFLASLPGRTAEEAVAAVERR